MIRNLCSLAVLILAFSGLSVSAQEKTPPKIISGGVVNGKAQSLPKPAYPAAALAVRASGAVNVQVTIDEAGNVIEAAAVSGHPLLRAASVEAARQAKFSPTRLNGEPVKVTGVVVYNFIAPAAENHEERLKLLALGAVLSMARSEKLIKAEEFADMPSDVTEYAAELAPLKSLKDLPPAEREQTLARVSDALKTRLGGTDLNEFEIGRALGEIMLEIGKVDENKTYQLNEAALKENLSKIKSLLRATGPDFPPAVMEQFVLLADLADKPALTSEDNITTLGFRMMRIVEAVSPEVFK